MCNFLIQRFLEVLEGSLFLCGWSVTCECRIIKLLKFYFYFSGMVDML